MTALNPQVDFARMGADDFATIGLDAAEAAFQRDVEAGLTNGDSLAIVVGTVELGTWHQLGSRYFGPDAAEFAANIDPSTGKLATVLNEQMDTIDAYAQREDAIPEGPQRFTGGVYHVARVKTENLDWRAKVFAGAASGVQGHLDMATVYTALTRMGAVWALHMQALHGKE